MHGTNSGLIIYNKKGEFIQGVSQKCFNNGIDPKMFFDVHNNVFVFDLWWYYDKPKVKPVNISVSETNNPLGAWNTYPVPAQNGVDGGGIGYSKKWIGYSFPGGKERTFILKTAEAKAGQPATIYHFEGSLGHPVFGQDDTEALYFFEIARKEFIIRKIAEDEKGIPYAVVVSQQPHHLKFIEYPPQSPQKGTTQKVQKLSQPVEIFINACFLSPLASGIISFTELEVIIPRDFKNSGKLSINSSAKSSGKLYWLNSSLVASGNLRSINSLRRISSLASRTPTIASISFIVLL